MVEQRAGMDRRRYPRGGRRDDDPRGYSPLVMVVGAQPARRRIIDRLLVMRHFAVAPVESIDAALAICRGLLPSVIVCDDADVQPLSQGLHPHVVPMIANRLDDESTGDLVNRIRRALGDAADPPPRLPR
jgi:CheY-like chemotaxis protein